MRFKIVGALAVAVLLLLGTVAAGATLSKGDSASATGTTATGTIASGATATGPASAASDRRPRPGDRPGNGSNDAWKRLSPAEKSDTMRRLAREHQRGMRAWVACRAAGRDDCVRPLPPGLAKKR